MGSIGTARQTVPPVWWRLT